MRELRQGFYLWGMIKSRMTDNILLCFLFVLWCLEFFGHIHFLNTHFQNYINSDYAGDAIFAKHLADTGNFLFSLDWFPTTELYVIHHQIIMTPLFYFVNDYKTVWLITSVIAFIMLSFSIIFFMQSFKATKVLSFLAVVLFFNPICKLYMEFNIYFHGYLFYFIFGFLIMGLIGRIFLKNEFIPKDMFFLFILSFLGGLCEARMFIIVFLPLLLSFIIMNYNSSIRKLNSLHLRVLGLIFVSSVLGIGLHFFLGKYCANASHSHFRLQDADCIANNLLSLPTMIFRGLWPISGKQFSALGSVIFWTCCAFGIYKFQITGTKEKSAGVYTWIRYFLGICILFNLFLMIIGLEHDSFLGSHRYFMLSTYCLIPVFVLTLGYGEQTCGKICSIMVICLFFISGGYEYRKMMKMEVPVSWRDGYINFLIDNNLNFGMSTYWNANATIFMTHNKVEIVPVDETNLELYKWNTRKSYGNRKPQFLLLTSKEFEDRKKLKQDDVILYKDKYVVILKI